MIHTYLGFKKQPGPGVLDRPLSLDALGFPGGGPWIHEARSDQYVVGVFGDSVAWMFATNGGTDRLFDGLSAMPGIAGRRLVATSAAVPGYK